MLKIRLPTAKSYIKSAAHPQIDIPDNWNTLDEFVEWWLAAGMPYRMPQGCSTAITDIAWTIPIFRHKQYQVELYILNKVLHLNEHRHPGVEVHQMSLDMPGMIWGEFFGGNQGDVPHGRNPEPNAPEIPGTLLTFEKWDEGIKPTVVCAVWEGKSLGPIHRETIKKFYPYVDISNEYVTNSPELMRAF